MYVCLYVCMYKCMYIQYIQGLCQSRCPIINFSCYNGNYISVGYGVFYAVRVIGYSICNEGKTNNYSQELLFQLIPLPSITSRHESWFCHWGRRSWYIYRANTTHSIFKFLCLSIVPSRHVMYIHCRSWHSMLITWTMCFMLVQLYVCKGWWAVVFGIEPWSSSPWPPTWLAELPGLMILPFNYTIQ
jgi:hypothetical protein